MSKRSLPFNVKFVEAAQHFAAKVPLTRPQFDLLSNWAKLRAFTVATVTKARVLHGMQDALQQAIDDGLTFADFNATLNDVLKVKLKPWHAETVFRTNTQSAYGSGRLQQQREQKADFPFIQIHEVGDERTRVSHRPRNGVVLSLSDARVRVWYPPSDYNCRGWAESLTTEEATGIGIAPVNIIADPNDSNGFAGPGASDEYEPNISKLNPKLSARVRAAIEAFDPADVED